MRVRSAATVWVMSVLVAAPAAAELPAAHELAGAHELAPGTGREEPPLKGVSPTPCCGAAIVPAGHFEVEANYSGDGVRGSFVHTSNLTLKYSLTDRLQVQLGTANFMLGGGGVGARAFDGVAPGLKLVVLEEAETWPQLALSVHGVFPTLTREDALQSTIDFSVMVYASKDLGPLHLDATLSLLVADVPGVPALQGGASLTATWNLTDQWALATGPYSTFGNAERLGVDGGWFGAVNWSPFPQVVLSGGVEAGFFQETRSYSVFAGVAWVPTASARIPLALKPLEAPPQVAAR